MSERAVVDPQERLIFAMGGGGFTMEPNNPLLDDFVLSLPGTAEPKILFLPTASGETTAHLNAFRERFAHRTCVASDLSLFRLSETTRALEEVVLEQDIVYVGGGSMRNLLALWHAHGLDRILLRAWEGGTVLAGLGGGAHRAGSLTRPPMLAAASARERPGGPHPRRRRGSPCPHPVPPRPSRRRARRRGSRRQGVSHGCARPTPPHGRHLPAGTS